MQYSQVWRLTCISAVDGGNHSLCERTIALPVTVRGREYPYGLRIEGLGNVFGPLQTLHKLPVTEKALVGNQPYEPL